MFSVMSVIVFSFLDCMSISENKLTSTTTINFKKKQYNDLEVKIKESPKNSRNKPNSFTLASVNLGVICPRIMIE